MLYSCNLSRTEFFWNAKYFPRKTDKSRSVRCSELSNTDSIDFYTYRAKLSRNNSKKKKNANFANPNINDIRGYRVLYQQLLYGCTVGFFVLHDVFGRRPVAVVVPLHADRRAGHGHHSQVAGSVRRLLHVQLDQLLVSAVHVARLAHVRTAVFHLHVVDVQRSDDSLAERLLSFGEPKRRKKKKTMRRHNVNCD